MKLSRWINRRTDAVSWGVHLSFLSAELTEFFGTLGFRWLLLDAQRTPLDFGRCRELVRAADSVEMYCVVRIAQISTPVIEGYLDTGVLGILAPNVSSAAQARKLVAAVKFSPEGKRGAAFHTRAASYGLIERAAEYCRTANRATFTAALIESQAGISELDAIAAVPGLDYLSIGMNDLKLSSGLAIDALDADLQSTIETAKAHIKVLGKPQIAVVRDHEQARQALAEGARLIAVSDAALLATAGRRFLRATQAATS